MKIRISKRQTAAAVVAVTALPLLAVSALAQAPAAGAAASGPPAASGVSGASTYSSNCASCHGTLQTPGSAGTVFNHDKLSKQSDDQLAKLIEDTHTPPFKGKISDNDVRMTIAYLRIQGGLNRPQAPFDLTPNGKIYKTEKQKFRIDVIARGLETPWGESFLPDGRLLVTERPGRLRIISKDGVLDPKPVSGTPKVFERQDAGMLDVLVDPNYAKTGWIYLSYVEADPNFVQPPVPPGTNPMRMPSPPNLTVWVRGKLNAQNEWVNQETVFRADPKFQTGSVIHYGSRFLLDGKGHIFFTLGERGDMTNAQKLDTPLGKVHRINEDLSVPKDNPFVNTPGADPTIWTYGHRNPEGLSIDPVTGALWETEHGPTGGDELNLIQKGHNYGWGVISMGAQPGITHQHEAGMEDPKAYYTPTVAPSGISFYKGNRYPGWKNNLFIGMLAGQQLRRVEVKGDKVVHQETLFNDLGRTRDVITGPDGLLYVLLQTPTGGKTGLGLAASTPGQVIRLTPVK
jgi:glucose/arabinose dehydrogenase/cytochrome c5